MSESKTKVRRKAPKLDVPQPGQDAAERKRVLNVLAQRRYRQRRREHIQKLEAQVGTTEVENRTGESPGSDGNDQPLSQTVEDATFKSCTTQPPSQSAAYIESDLFETDQAYSAPLQEITNATQPDPFACYDANPFTPGADGPWLWDTSVLLPSLPSTPLSSSNHSSSTTGSHEETGSSTASLSAVVRSPREASSPGFAASQDLRYSFPDEANLDILELTLLRGCMMIAGRMDIQSTMWSLSATSPFTDPSLALTSMANLPLNLQPTMLQMTVPHHPIIDLLPWPSARDALIKVLQQPPEFRPPGAASPMALLDFVYDLEDSAEGVRISGSDPYSGENWEVGEKVFRSWWWMFNKDIIRRSNELRALRGAPMLGLGAVLGEVT